MQGRNALIVKDGRIMIFENGILRVVLWEPQRRKMLRKKQIQKFQKLKRRCRNDNLRMRDRSKISATAYGRP